MSYRQTKTVTLTSKPTMETLWTQRATELQIAMLKIIHCPLATRPSIVYRSEAETIQISVRGSGLAALPNVPPSALAAFTRPRSMNF